MRSVIRGRFGKATRLHGPALAVLVGLTAIMCRNLIFSGAFPGGWDIMSVVYPVTYFARIGSYFSLWEDSGAGYVTPITLLHLLSSLADLMGDPAFIARSVLILSVLTAGLLMYLYTYLTTRKPLASLVSGIVFSTSQWFAAKVASGQGFLAVAYCLLPLIFLLTDRGLRRAKLGYVLGLGLVLSLLPSLRFDPIAYICPFVMLFLVWHVVTARREWKRATINAVRLLLPAIILGGLLSAYVWLPLLKTGTAHTTVQFSLWQIANDTLDFWPTLRGQGLVYSYIFWRGNTSLYTHQFLPPLAYGLVMLLTPALAFAQVRLWGDRRASFFLTAAVISLFLAKGPWQPLGEVYLYLWRYIPFFDRLHVANRWLMVTWLAYAFLAGLTLDSIYRFVRARFEAMGRWKLARLASTITVILILLGSTVGISYVFTDGYQTWDVPQEEVAPHKWLAQDGERGRFMPVPYGQNRMFVQGGWLQHDLGVVAGIFNGQPSVGTSYFEDYSDDFFSYAETLVVNQSTDGLAKIMGAYDVRYVVVQGYSSDAAMRRSLLYSDSPVIAVEQDYSQHDYFDGLEGLRKVFEGPDPGYTLLVGEKTERELTYHAKGPRLWSLEPQRRSAVYENDYWVPRLFVPRRQMVIVGGLESLDTLSEFEEFNFQDWDLRFASRTLNELGQERLIEAVANAELLVFVNSELLDLAMMMGDSARVDFAPIAHDPETPWSLRSYPTSFTDDRTVLQTSRNHAQITLPISLPGESPGQDYELWARVLYGREAGLVNFAVDGEEVGSLLPGARNWVGFVWEKVGTVTLESGSHAVSITALATDVDLEIRVDEVALVRAGAIDEAENLLGEIIREADLEVMSLQHLGRLWSPPKASTHLSRYRELEIRLEHPEEAGIEQILFGERRQAPRFWPSGRFFVWKTDSTDGSAPLLRIEFMEPQDWVDSTYLRFGFRGANSGGQIRLQISFADSGIATYWFEDLSSDWQTIYIPLFDPDATDGIMQWDKVSSLSIDILEVELQKGIGLGPFALLEDSLTLQHLGPGLGMKTFLFSTTEPSPPSAAALLSATAPQPARILEWEQVSPSLYHVRVDADAPYTLVLSNTYHPLWRVIIDGREIEPGPSYYFVNAYTIDKVGEYDFTVEFVGQRYQRFGFVVSAVGYAVTSLALAACLLWPWVRRKRRTTD